VSFSSFLSILSLCHSFFFSSNQRSIFLISIIILLQDIRGVHIRFIDECFERLEDLTNQNAGGSPARTTSGNITDPEVKLQAIERLLILAQRYIATVEVS